MNILIDIIHPADVNFYKNAVEELAKKGHKITFTVIKRGKLQEITKKEYPSFEIIKMGTHKKGFIGKIIGIITRELKFFSLYSKRKFDVVSSFGFYPGMFAKIFGAKAIQFHDDREYKLNYFLTRFFSTRFISLCEEKSHGKTIAINSYKELAYLNPDRIKEDLGILKKLKITKEKYIYVRDVGNISLNYSSNRLFSYSKLFKYARKKGYSIIYDAEHDPKGNACIYSNVKKLEGTYTYKEMISIKKNAALVVTSGDTVLREAALMGTPVIYTSKREMAVNQKLKQKGMFEKALNEEELLLKGKQLMRKEEKQLAKKKASQEIKQCLDMTDIIIKELTNS